MRIIHLQHANRRPINQELLMISTTVSRRSELFVQWSIPLIYYVSDPLILRYSVYRFLTRLAMRRCQIVSHLLILHINHRGRF
jgi:hypothetical protein